MKAKTVLAATLALFLGSCSCLMPLAAAASSSSEAKQDHSCCPSTPKAEQSSDCCMRAAVPATASFAAPQFVVVGVVVQPAAPILTGLGAIVHPNTLSPPDKPFASSRSSRAPPSLLA